MNWREGRNTPDGHSASDWHDTLDQHRVPSWREMRDLLGVVRPDVWRIPRGNNGVDGQYVTDRHRAMGDRPVPEDIRRRLRNAKLDLLLARLDAVMAN